MRDNKVTLKDLVIKEDENLNDRFSKMEARKIISKIKEQSSTEVKWIKWPKIYNEILKKLAEALDINILSIITDALVQNDIFNKIKQVRDARKDETVLIPLAEKTIESTYDPYIEILFNEEVITKIDFEVKLTITLKALLLKFRNRKLLEIEAGECLIKGTLSCESVEITTFSSTIRIPEAIIIDGEPLKQKEPAEALND